MSRPRINSARSQLRRHKELRAKCVSGKKRYRTEEQAQAALDRIQSKDEPGRSKIPQRVYPCTFDGCGGWHLTSKRVPLVSRSPLPQRSTKTAATYRKLRVPLVVETLEARPWCERCGQRATEVHEKVRRSQARQAILDRSVLVALCHTCHQWVTEHPQAAHGEGWVMWGTEYRNRKDEAS